MKRKIDFYSRVMVAIVLALLASQLLVREVFLGYSPRIRPDLADVLVNKTLSLVNIDNYLAFFRGKKKSPSLTEKQALKELSKVDLKPTLVKGVYAKESENASLIQINMTEVEWVEVPYVRANGENIMLRIPKGTQPPANGLF